MKKLIDAKKGQAVYEFNGQTVNVNLAGLDMETFTYLALLGAHDILLRRKDPVKSWEEIANGKLARPRNYDPIIHALSTVYSLSLEDAAAMWEKLDRAGKLELRKDTRVKQALIDYEASDPYLVDPRKLLK